MPEKIEIVTNLFHPDQLGGANLYTDMAAYFRDLGWATKVTTTFSYYPDWQITDADKGIFRREDLVDRNPVTRLKMYVPKVPGGKGRILSEISFLAALLWNEMMYGKRSDIVITACPMLSQCCYVALMNIKKSSPVLIIVQDFAIGAAEDLGIIQSSLVLKWLNRFEEWCLSSASVLSSISRPMVARLKSKLADCPVYHIPNWIHSSLEDLTAQGGGGHSITREKNKIFYSGNIGVKQVLDEFVDLFIKQEFADWELEIRGKGARLKFVHTSAEDCERVHFGEVQSEKEYVSSLRTCTFYLITQKAVSGDNSFPSKLLPALATGTPVLAVCDSRTALGEAVLEGNFGEVVSMNFSEIQVTLKRWKESPELLSEYSGNALKAAKEYSREKVLGNYHHVIQSLLDDEKRNSH